MSRTKTSDRKKTGTPASGPSLTDRIAAGILVLLCAAAFFNTLGNGFVYDDRDTIVGNAMIKSPGNLRLLFDRSYFAASAEKSYRPVTTASYFLYHALFGERPAGYHLAGLALHIAVTLLVYALARTLFSGPWPALAAAALFGVHPAISEAVNCISYNDDMLAALFFLLGLRAFTGAGRGGPVAASVFYLLSLFSKEMGITLPVIALAFDFFSGGGPTTKSPEMPAKRMLRIIGEKRGYVIGFGAAFLLYAAVRFWAMPGVADPMEKLHGDFATRLVMSPVVLFSHLWIMLMPVSLNADHLFRYPPLLSPASGAAAGAIALMVWVIVTKRTQCPPLSLGLFWFAIAMLPALNLVPIANPVAERYLYLPSVGCALSAAGLAVALRARRPRFGASVIAAFVLIIAIGAVLTVNRNRIWKDDFSLWSATVRREGATPRAYINLGVYYLDHQNYAEAIAQFARAAEIDSRTFYEANYNLGVAYSETGRLDRAMEAFNRVMAVNPAHAPTHNGIGTVYGRQGNVEAAIAEYRKAIGLDPWYMDARFNLGAALFNAGQRDQAIAEWQRLLSIDPQHRQTLDALQRVRNMTVQGKSAP